MISKWAKDLTVADLPNDDLKLVADLYGLEFALNLMEDLAGSMICIPKTAFNQARNRYLCQEYDGSKRSRVLLALKFGVTEGYIKQLVSKHRKKAS